MIKLAPYQKEAKKYIEWLLSKEWSTNGVGRTYLMAIIFIEQAIEKPEIWINVWDHGPYFPRKEEHILDVIKNIVHQHYPEWDFKIKHSINAFLLRKKTI